MISTQTKVFVLACNVRDRLLCLLNERDMPPEVRSQVEQAEKDVSEIVDRLEGRGNPQ